MKLTVREVGTGVTVKLEGRVSLQMTDELVRGWEDLAPLLNGRKLIIDLRDVNYLSAAGSHVLAGIYRETGAVLLADTPLTKYFADEVKTRHPK